MKRREARTLSRAASVLSEACNKAQEFEEEVNKKLRQVESLKSWARLEDLSVWKAGKTKRTKKGRATYSYWTASWREGDKVRNLHLGSCKKMTKEEALTKARQLKAKSLGIG